jgi:hypothetical protein
MERVRVAGNDPRDPRTIAHQPPRCFPDSGVRNPLTDQFGRTTMHDQ